MTHCKPQMTHGEIEWQLIQNINNNITKITQIGENMSKIVFGEVDWAETQALQKMTI